MGVAALIEQLKTMPDWRRGRQVQYPLWLMLLLSLVGVMSGYSSLRGLEAFMQRHQQEVAECFGLAKAKLPSYSTLRDRAQHVDPLKVAELLMAWAKQALPVEAGPVISLDGLRSKRAMARSRLLSGWSVRVCNSGMVWLGS